MAAPIPIPKSYQRLGAFPLDTTSVFETLAELQTYAATGGTAYAGQVCSVSGSGKVYVIQSDRSLLELGIESGGVTVTRDLDRMFTSAHENYYHEVLYNGSGDVSAIEVYTDSAKATRLFSRTFTYDGAGNLTLVTTTDQQNAGVSLTKTLSYNAQGDISSVARTYNF